MYIPKILKEYFINCFSDKEYNIRLRGWIKIMAKLRNKENTGKGKFILLGAILIVLVVVISIQSAYLISINDRLNILSADLDDAKEELGMEIASGKQDLEGKISGLSSELSDVETELGKEIVSLKAETSADFSGIIEDVVDSVVTIQTDAGQGSGFILTSDGYVITNAHVFAGATYANAILSDQRSKPMTLIGYDIPLDIALLKIEGNYDSLPIGNSDDVQIGEKVIAIGNPLGLSFSVSEGIVSAVNREGSNGLPYYIQTDTALNPGNSGGPLINTDGEVIGINNFKIAGGENLGFSLESNYIEDSVNEISLERLDEIIL